MTSHTRPILHLLLLGGLLGACIPDNPAVTREIRWADAETEALARRACYDCHSNETDWPWYTRVPGVGAMVKGDVRRAREHMNFSTWDQENKDAEDAPEEVLEGEMPLPLYIKHHEEADLTDAERAALAEGLRATFAADPPLGGDGADDREDDEDDD